MRLRSSPDHRAAVLRRFSTNGLSLAAFCRQEGLAYQSVLAWRKAHGCSRHEAKAGQEFVPVECLGTWPAAPGAAQTTEWVYGAMHIWIRRAVEEDFCRYLAGGACRRTKLVL